ncbi:MAG: threonylcarbamoyl-AMP synthase [Gammaproteobacteria bacterium]|nr:threonylcarbamoyl-AMP synthase [Gammaproteobacteria bacterium]
MLPDPVLFERAATLLRAGELVAFPTETVYGLGADARNPAAVARIFAAKGRPASHPLIVHVRDLAAASEWAATVPEAARRLAATFWPGPLTLVLPRARAVPDAVTGGQPTVALRAPAHPVAQALLAAFGGGIAAPSANRYGHISPTRAAHVVAELGDRVALILDGGDCPIGLESTIVGCTEQGLTLLRPGGIPASRIAAVAGPLVAPGAAVPRVPGSERAHYAPRTPMQLVDPGRLPGAAGMALAEGERIAVLAWSPPPPDAAGCVWRQLGPEPESYARQLYATLRELDEARVTRILVEQVPEAEPWAAIADRLRRAAAGSGMALPDAP